MGERTSARQKGTCVSSCISPVSEVKALRLEGEGSGDASSVLSAASLKKHQAWHGFLALLHTPNHPESFYVHQGTEEREFKPGSQLAR